ncbi:MAG: hypothetical protein FWD91_04675 [Treponema sp.]|nr:hypothetical protein [Treponema sp.]
MNKRVNFEDNLFILTMHLRVLQDVITLDVEAEFFLGKTLDDIYFADHLLATLLGSLQENNFLIDREEVLEHFASVETLFSNVVQSLLNHNGNMAIQGAPSIVEKLAVCRDNSLARQESIESLYPSSSTQSSSSVVSSVELAELLKGL